MQISEDVVSIKVVVQGPKWWLLDLDLDLYTLKYEGITFLLNVENRMAWGAASCARSPPGSGGVTRDNRTCEDLSQLRSRGHLRQPILERHGNSQLESTSFVRVH